ncbi:MAG TPA: efflux RND transporter periplasmic adaptor subunit [Candidatus Paceibacterota bacterium]|nr:efflux RND transporter periplasmic adaptor subunit [Candidatus Paceibacterota bacterium]
MNKSFFGKVGTWAAAHKVLATVIVVVLVGGGYGVWKKQTAASAPVKYILATAAKGTLVTAVSGSGQVQAENQVTVASTVSGMVTGVYVNDGDEVQEGQTLATIDDSDAVRAVDNAELALENARVAYDKAVKDAADQASTSTVSDLAKAYQSGYNAIVATAIDLPSIFAGLDDIYYSSTHSPYFSDISVSTEVGTEAAAYKSQAGAAFDSARAEYDANFLRYKNISQNSSPEEIVSLLNETNVILTKLLSALSGTYSTLDYIQNRLSTVPSQLTTDKATVSSDVTKVNSDSANITSALNDIDNAQTSGTTADLSMKSAELTVKQDEAALSDANTTLANHRIVAPFSGLVAKVIAKKGDTASNNTQIATVVTKEQMVNISLNEIDAAKVAKNDKVTLTFDAIDGLSLTGHVTNVDLVGTVSQGVVSYNVEIAFDATDPRVKPGMTVNANIITGVKQDALLVPASAVKTQGGNSYVQVLSQKYDESSAAQGVTSSIAPSSVPVTVGATNDSQAEITEGLFEGDQVVSRTVTSTAKSTAAPSILSGLGGNRAAGGNVRFVSGGTGAGR